MYITQTLTHAWVANPLNSCELLRDFDDEKAYTVHQSYMEFPKVTWLSDMVKYNLTDNDQAVFSAGASVVTSLSRTS